MKYSSVASRSASRLALSRLGDGLFKDLAPIQWLQESRDSCHCGAMFTVNCTGCGPNSDNPESLLLLAQRDECLRANYCEASVTLQKDSWLLK